MMNIYPCSKHILIRNYLFQDLGLGKFCCPQGKGKDSICCNTDPNPPPPTISPQQSKGDAPSIQATAFTSSLVVTFFFSWLMWVNEKKIENVTLINKCASHIFQTFGIDSNFMKTYIALDLVTIWLTKVTMTYNSSWSCIRCP